MSHTPLQLEQTWAAATRALRHATQWNAASVALSTVNRRKAFLASTDFTKVPDRARNWLQFQPLPTNDSPGLFGDTMHTLRHLARDEGQSRLLSWASRSSTSSTYAREPNPQHFREQGNMPPLPVAPRGPGTSGLMLDVWLTSLWIGCISLFPTGT